MQQLAQMRAQVDSVPPEADAGALMQAAALARNLGDVWKTEALLRGVLKQAPRDQKGRTRLADTLEREMRLPEARALYDGLRKENPADVRAYLGLAGVAFTQHRRDEAWAWLDRAVEPCGKSAPDLLLIAQRYEQWDDLANANKVLQCAEAVAPNDAALAVERATLLLRAGKPERARGVIEPIVKREPDNAAAWKALAKAWAAAPVMPGQKTAAVQTAERALSLNAQDPDAHRDAALIYRALGEPRHAAAELAQSLAVSPNQVDARYMLAQLYGELGKPDWRREELVACDRVRALQRAQQLAIGRAAERPTDPAARTDVGRSMEALGDYGGAIREYQTAVGMAPGDAPARSALAAIYDRLAWGTPPKGPAR